MHQPRLYGLSPLAVLLATLVSAGIGLALIAIAIAITPGRDPALFQRSATVVVLPFLLLGAVAVLVGPRAGLRSIFGPLERAEYEVALSRLFRGKKLGFPVDGLIAAFLLQAGRPAEAEPIFRRLLTDDDPYYAAHATGLATCLLLRGELDEAEDRLNDALAADPSHAGAHALLAELDLLRGRAHTGTLHDADVAVELALGEGKRRWVDENRAAVMIATRAWALAVLGRGEEARADLALAMGMVEGQRHLGGRAAVCWRAGHTLAVLDDPDGSRMSFELGARLDRGLEGERCRRELA